MNLKKLLKYKYIFTFLTILLLVFIYLWSTKKPANFVSSPEKKLESYTLKNQARGKLVADFPDLPIYSGAKLMESTSYTEEEGLGFSAKYQINDSLINIFNWYQERLVERGWEVSYASQLKREPNNFLLEVVKRGQAERDTVVLGINGLKSEDKTALLILSYHKGMGEYGPASNDE